jgi:hypothetical protein
MKKIITTLVIIVLVLPFPIRAGIPITDLLGYGQRITNWVKENLQWITYLKDFGSKSDTPNQSDAWNFLNSFRQLTRVYNTGFLDGLNGIAELRLDLESLELYVNQVCDLNLNTWKGIFIDGKKIEMKKPELVDFGPIRRNKLNANPNVKAITEKIITLKLDKVKRINLISQLIVEINGIEKSIAKQVGDIQKQVDEFSKATDDKAPAEISKLMYSHAAIRLQTMRARIFGVTLMRTLIEMRLKNQVEDEEMNVLQQKLTAEEVKNLNQIKGEN